MTKSLSGQKRPGKKERSREKRSNHCAIVLTELKKKSTRRLRQNNDLIRHSLIRRSTTKLIGTSYVNCFLIRRGTRSSIKNWKASGWRPRTYWNKRMTLPRVNLRPGSFRLILNPLCDPIGWRRININKDHGLIA